MTTAPSPATRWISSSHVPALDGVRGLAILLVMIFHFSPRALPSLVERLLLKVQHAGWCGVDLFFVLSGFLITGILLDTKSSSNYFASFYARRVLRIFPLYYGALLCAVFVVPSLTGVAVFPPGEQVWYWLYVSNWRSALSNDIYGLTHFWTLAIEEQFYLVWPFVVFHCRRRLLAKICVSIIVLALILRLGFLAAGFGALFLQRATPLRMDSLAMGALVALAMRDDSWKALARRLYRPAIIVGCSMFGLVTLVSLGAEMVKPQVQTFGVSALVLLFAALVFAAADGRSATLDRILTWSPLRSMGAYSYAMYVLHWPLNLLLLKYVEPFQESTSLSTRLLACYGTILFGMALSYLLARLSWVVWEAHFIKLKRWFTPVPATLDAIP